LQNIDSQQVTDLKEGKCLPIMEEFYSLQGEGYHTGKPAYFLRLGGCDTGCAWCDIKASWNPDVFPLVSVTNIVNRIIACPAKALVVTGGEPLHYNLTPLCISVRKHGVECFLETCGAPKLSGVWDWICLSPKKESPPDKDIFCLAHELKVIIHNDADFEWAEKNTEFVNKKCLLYLQPEWSQTKKMLPEIVDYIKKNPKWSISLQSHKYMNIP